MPHTICINTQVPPTSGRLFEPHPILVNTFLNSYQKTLKGFNLALPNDNVNMKKQWLET